MRRHYTGMLLTVLTAFTLYAGAMAAEVRITYWGMSSSSEENERAVVNEFNKRNAGRIFVEAVSGISGSDLREKLNVAMAGNAAPDVVRFDRFALAQWADKGLFYSLDSRIARDKLSNADFYPSAWNETVYQGKVYGIPWNMDARAYVYNKTAFAESGLNPSLPPKSWEDTLAYARKLDRNDGSKFNRIGFLAHEGNWYFIGWLLSAGGQLVDNTGRKVAWNSDQGRKSAQFMKDVVDYYGGYKAASIVLGGSSSTAMANGTLTSVVDYSGFVSSALKRNPALEIGVGAPPRPAALANEKMSWSGGFAMSIPITVQESKVDAIWEFIKFFTSKEGMMIAFRADITGQLPTRRSVVTDPEYFSNQPAPLTGFFELLPYATFRQVLPDGESLYELYRRRLVDMIMKENVVPDQAVAETARLGQIILDTRWAGR